MRLPLRLVLTLGLASSATAQTGTALVKHAPTLNGTIQGSIQQMLGENVVLNGGTSVTGDLLVPGLPTVQRNGNPTYAGSMDGIGATTPTGYQITLNGGVSLRHVIRRTNPVTLPAVAAPPSPTGSRTVLINSAGQSAGDFATLRHLTLNGSVGQYAIPPGTYGDFTANGGAGFTLGVAGATIPAVYNFQHLTLNGSTRLQIAGPVVVTVAYGFTANGNTGSSTNPAWLTLKIYSGNFTLNGGSNLYGYLTAPGGTVIVNGNSQLVGGVISDRLIVNGSGLLKLAQPVTANQPPTANPLAVTTPEDVAKSVLLTATDPDGGALNYTVVTAPAHGTLSGVAPNLTYTPAANFNGADGFTFKASDGQADSPAATVSITVTPVNDAPVATPRTLSTDEDTPVSVTLTGTDLETNALTFSVTTPPTHGALSGTPPNLTYTPALNYYGPDVFAFTASDGSLNSAPASVSITVTPVNDAPVATPRSVSVQSGSSVGVALTGSDVDGDALTFSTVTLPAHGSLSGAAPNFTYTPVPGFIGSDSFTFRAFDGLAYSAPVAVAISVAPQPNRAPFAEAQTISTPEDTARVIALSGSDPDGDALAFALLTQPGHGALQPRPGFPSSYTYTPAAEYSGPDSFTFKVSDGTLDSAAATISLTVTPVNDAPVANAQTVATDEDTALVLTLTGSDVENSALTYSITTPPLHGTLAPGPATPGGFVYTPAADYSGPDGFAFKVHDGELDSTAATVAITVRPVNDAPVAHAPAPVVTAEDTPVDLALAGTDADGDALTFTIEIPPAHGTLEPKPGAPASYIYTPEPDFNGADSFTFKASDAALDSDPALVSLTVTPVNDAPVTTGQTLTLPQDTANDLTLAATDVENDPLAYQIVSLPAHGVLSGTGANRTYTSAPGYEGPDAFTFKASDGALDSNVSTVELIIVDINHPPVASGQSATLVEDTPTTLTLLATDADGDPLTYTIVIPPAHGTLAPQPGTPANFVYTPAADYSGPDAFVFRAKDGSVDSAPATFSLTVTPVNDAPVAIPQALTTDEDVALPIILAGTDVDSSALTYAIVTPPANGTLTPQGGDPRVYTYTPALDYSGSDSFTFRLNDGALDSAPATVAITVRPINDAPVAVAPADVSVSEDTSVDIILAGSDVDSTELARVIVALPNHGTLTPKVGELSIYTYTPAPNYFGSDSFSFRLNDGLADSNLATVTIDVTAVNDLPIANAASVALMSGVPTPVTLTGTDVETAPASLVYTVVAGPAHGALIGAAPYLTYTSAPDFGGFDSFTFTVNDGTATSLPATIQLHSGLPPRSRTYTTTEDFNQGSLVSISRDVRNQISNRTVLAAYDSVWVANSSKGTVVKLDSETARVLGEYRTAPESVPSPYPSRIAVDSKGNAWVANYSHDSIVKLGQPENGYWSDRDGNGVAETSVSLGDLKPWAGPDSIASASDEAILLYVRTAVAGVRHLSVDADDNVWVGGPNGVWQKFNGDTGVLLRTEPTLGLGGQGGFISLDGKLHSIGGDFLIWQTSDPIAAQPASAHIMENAWGCALDSQGNLWVTRDGTSTIVKYSPIGEKLGEYYHGEPWAMGVAIDANDHVWVAHSHCGRSVGHLLPDGRLVGNVEVANHGPVEVSIDRHGRIWVVSSTGVVESINPLGGPLGSDGVTPVGEVDLKSGNLGGALWTYGRFTGNAFALSAPDGWWTNIYDGVLAGSTWGPVVWNGVIGNDAKLEVEAALGADGVSFGAYQPLTLVSPVPTGSGRFLKTRVRLVSATTGETPALHDLTVGTTGYTPPPTVPVWFVSAGDDIAGNWPDRIQLKGAFMHSAHEFTTSPTYAWSVVSAPAGGTVSFTSATELRPKALFSVKGTYVLRVTATLDGVVSTDDVTLVLTPYNRAPYANAGYTTFVASFPPQIWLWGEVRDDGLPIGANVVSTWEKLFGPGTVSFTNASAPATQASFSVPGVYTMRLRATDGELAGENTTDIWIGVPPPPPPPEGLVSWWSASGNGDDHISGNQAFTERGTTYADGKIAGGFRFDGINDGVRVFSAPSLDVGGKDGLTVELWVKPSAERTATLFQYGTGIARGFQIRQINRTLEVSFREAGGTEHLLTTGSVLAVNTWTHLAASYDRATGEARVFANGILQATQNPGTITPATDFDVYMGSRADGTEPYSGVLDEISVYNRALFADEVTTIVTAGKRPPVSNLPPVVTAGADLLNQPANAPVMLTGTVTDDGQPINGALTSTWSKVVGPGTVTFGNAVQAQTTATFSVAGLYVMKLTADDGAFDASDTVEVRVATVGQFQPDDSLAAWWPGNRNDLDVIHGRKMERFHGMNFGPGQTEQGFLLSGGTAHGRVAAHSDLNIGASAAGLTIELWVKSNGNQEGPLVQWTNGTTEGLGFRQGNLDHLLAWITETDNQPHVFDGGGAFSPNAWTHVALTYDKSTGVGRLYRNGSLLKEQNLGVFTPQTSYPIQMGASSREGRYFQGTLDEISLYTRPLSLSEIQAIYATGTTGKNPVDGNAPPVVSAGSDVAVASVSSVANLAGVVSDDGLPAGGTFSTGWSKVDGPGAVTFANANSASTTATFSAVGTYILRLSGNDGFKQSSDTVVVRVGLAGLVQPDASLAAWWPGNGDPHEVIHGNHDIDLANGMTYGAGQVSQGFVLGAGGAHGRVAAHSDLNIGASAAGLTIELWVKSNGNQEGPLVQWTNGTTEGLGFRQGNLDHLLAWITETDNQPHVFDGGGAFSPNAWTHVALTYDKSTGVGRLYRNGSLLKEQNLGVFTPQTSYPIQIGASSREGRYFQGTLDEISLYTRPLSLAQISSIYQAGPQGKAPLVTNTAPVANAGVDKSTYVGIPLALTGSSVDDGLPTPPGSQTYQWSLVAGPGTVSFTTPTALATSATFSALGSYTLRLSASDSELTGDDDVIVTVTSAAPTVALTAPINNTALTAGTATTLTAIAADVDGTVVKVEFFDGATKLGEDLASPYSLVLPTGFSAGSHTLTAKATDDSGLTTTSASVTVTSAAPPSQPPAISIYEPLANAAFGINVPFDLSVTATDVDGTIAKVEFFQNGVKIGQQTQSELGHPTTYFWQLTAGLPAGTYTFTARATDNSGATTMSAPITVGVSDNPVVSNPLFIATPDDSARVAAPTAITGIVALPGLTSWSLQYRLRPPGDDTAGSAEPWLNAASGTAAIGSAATSASPAVPAVIGTFDPTGLINGLYELRLSATTPASTTTTSPINLIVEGNMKVGAFTLAFEDLKVLVAGIPISVIRTYDSRDARVGDFGPGWSIAVANVRVQKNRHLGAAWYQTPQSGNGIQFYYVDPLRERIVTITMPDGETHRFRAGADVKVRSGDPDNASFAVVVRRGKYRFYPLGDTTAKLEPLNESNELADDFWIEGTGDQDLRGDDPVANPFAPTFSTSRFRLTTKDGSVYLVDERLGLLELRDLNGNTLVLNRDAQNRVTSLVSNQSSCGGASVATITISRDAAGRVDYIRDPASRDVDYIYDASGRLASVTNRALEVTQFRYENALFPCYLTKIVDPRGIAALRSEFDSAGKLIKQIDAEGKETVFTRGIDGTGRFEKVKDRLGNETAFYYDARGNVTLKIDPLGGQTAFAYDANDNPLTVTDPLGHTRFTTYDARNNPLSETDALGHSTTFTYNALGLPLILTDPRGKVTSNVYDGKGNLLSTTDAKGGVTSFIYDGGGRLTQIKNALNHTTTHAFTPEGWPASTTDALGHTTTWTYDSNGNRLTQSVTRTKADGSTSGEATAYSYDSENRLTQTTFADGTFSQTAYNAFGKPASTTDPLGRITRYTYDSRGNLTTTGYADGTSESSTFDDENRVIATTDRAGRTTSTSYDALGRPTQVNYADGTSSRTTYDAAGRVTTTTDARGNITTFGYDSAGRRTSVKNALNEITTSSFDENGGLVAFTDALGRTTNYGYDDTGLRTTTAFPDSTTQQTGYDALGRKISVADQAGKLMRWRYDALGRLTEVRQYPDQTIAAADADYHLPAGTSGLLITGYGYDEVGNQISQTDALGRITRYAYDALGRRIRRTLPGGQSETCTYDHAGNLSTKTDFNGYTTTYVYDSLNRLLEKRADTSHPSLSLAHAPAMYTYSYNALGQRTQASVFGGPAFGGAALYTETYAYDSRNRATTRTTSNGALTYAYDAQGNLASLKSNDAVAGLDLAYSYDALNRLSSVGTRDPLDGVRKVTSYDYDAAGNLSGVALPNGVAALYTYDALNRLKTLTADRLGTLLSSYTYTLNTAGHRTSVREINNRRHDYTYDALDRLTSETIVAGAADSAPAGVITYAHDAVGNRLSRTSTVPSISSVTSSYDSNDRLTTDTYDANGNTLQGAAAALPVGSTSDVYDFENRLISRNSGAIRLLYDSDGHRVSETVGAQTVSYLVDPLSPTGYAQVVEERVNGTLTRTYAYGHSLISQTQATLSPAWSTSYYGYDGHGSTAFLTDALGAVTDSYRYDAFGNLIARTNVAATPTFNRYRYTGQPYDDDLGLYYLRARYMNPDSGRFWNADEFEGFGGDPQSLHRYSYAGGNPVMGFDPSGNFTLFEVALTSTVVSTVAMIATPAVRPVVSTVIGYLGGSPNARYSLSSIGVYDESVELLSALGLSPEDFSKNLLADAFGELGTNAAVGAVTGGVGAGFAAFKRSTAALHGTDASTGGLNLFRAGKDGLSTREVGRAWSSGDRMLYLPNRGSPKANWKQNAGRLREEMKKGRPIYDSYRTSATGFQIPAGLNPSSGGRFLNAERKLLESKGWRYDPSNGAYYPPKS